MLTQVRRQGRRILWGPMPVVLAYTIALLLALLFIGAEYPLAFLRGEGGFFEDGDAAQHVSGWWFFARSWTGFDGTGLGGALNAYARFDARDLGFENNGSPASRRLHDQSRPKNTRPPPTHP